MSRDDVVTVRRRGRSQSTADKGGQDLACIGRMGRRSDTVSARTGANTSVKEAIE